MSGLLSWILPILTGVLAAWLSAIDLTLRIGGRSRIERALEERGKGPVWEPIADHLTDVAATISFLRMAISITFLCLWTVGIAGWPMAVGDFFIGVATGVVVLWILCDVLAAGIAKWAVQPIVTAGLPLMRVGVTIGRVPGFVVRFVDEVVKRLSGATLEKNGEQSEAEAALLRSVEQSHREGGLGETMAEMIENVVEFTSTDVGEVMTPRTEIEGIEFTNNLHDIKDFFGQEGHSRIPVYEEDLDHIIGILYVKDLVPFLGEDLATFKLQPLLRAPIVIPETKVVADLLADFQRSEVHMAIVVDEYGGTAGLVTIEDVLEEIVGEIKDEHEGDEEDQPELKSNEDGTWEVDGRVHIDDLNEALGVELPEDEEYDTVGGYLMACLGRVPESGDQFEVDGLRMTVAAASATQVNRITIQRVPEGVAD